MFHKGRPRRRAESRTLTLVTPASASGVRTPDSLSAAKAGLVFREIVRDDAYRGMIDPVLRANRAERAHKFRATSEATILRVAQIVRILKFFSVDLEVVPAAIGRWKRSGHRSDDEGAVLQGLRREIAEQSRVDASRESNG